MASAITSYINSCSAPDDLHLRLVIEKGTLLAKQKHEISCWTGLLALFGFGDAAFKNVWTHIRDHRSELKIDAKTWVTLNKVVDTYNTSHVFWKRVQEFNYSSLYNFDPLDMVEQKRIERLPLFPPLRASDVTDPVKMAAFCRDLRHKWCGQYHWEEYDAHELISYLGHFAETLTSNLDTLGKSKRFVNALLQLRIALKLSLVHGKTGSSISNQQLRFKIKAKLKEIQTAILRVWFKDDLAKQKEVLDRYVEAFKRHYGDASPFLKFELERWQHRHERAKRISFPKWNHCTPEARNVVSIFQSEIAYKMVKGFPGAFVSTNPEMENYGGWCFALSDHIEITGIKMADGRTRLPRYSKFLGDVAFAEEKHAFIPFLSLQNFYSWFGGSDAQIWFGFQKGIPIAQVLKREHPVEYYRDTTLSYLVYDEKKNVREPVLKHFPKNKFPHLPETIKVLTSPRENHDKSFFQNIFAPLQGASSFTPSKNSRELAQKGFDERKVHVITRTQLEQLRELFKKAKQQFTLPKDWEDRLQPCR